MKIINNFTRAGLGEGRTTGMCFGFAKKNKDFEYETVMPVTACKDYLNDALYAEKTGVLLDKIYGFEYEEINNIFNGDYTYIVIRIEGNIGDEYLENPNGPKFKQQREEFDKNYKKLEYIIRLIDEKIGIESKTEIIKANDNMFLVKAPMFWMSRLYLLSLYLLLLRALQSYKIEEDPFDVITKGPYYTQDNGLMLKAWPKLVKIMEGNLPEQEFDKIKEDAYIKLNSAVHNNSGIIGFNFN